MQHTGVTTIAQAVKRHGSHRRATARSRTASPPSTGCTWPSHRGGRSGGSAGESSRTRRSSSTWTWSSPTTTWALSSPPSQGRLRCRDAGAFSGPFVPRQTGFRCNSRSLGWNAHINHDDLVLALVETFAALDLDPDDPHLLADFDRVNALLGSLESQIRRSFEEAGWRWSSTSTSARSRTALMLVEHQSGAICSGLA